MIQAIRSFFTKQLGIPKETRREDMKAFIDEANNLFASNGLFIGSYSRRRDAVRGAKRRGMIVA